MARRDRRRSGGELANAAMRSATPVPTSKVHLAVNESVDDAALRSSRRGAIVWLAPLRVRVTCSRNRPGGLWTAEISTPRKTSGRSTRGAPRCRTSRPMWPGCRTAWRRIPTVAWRAPGHLGDATSQWPGLERDRVLVSDPARSDSTVGADGPDRGGFAGASARTACHGRLPHRVRPTKQRPVAGCVHEPVGRCERRPIGGTRGMAHCARWVAVHARVCALRVTR